MQIAACYPFFYMEAKSFGIEVIMNHTFEFIMGVISILSVIVTYFIVPYIKAGISSEKLEQYQEWAALAVKTAEMLWAETGHGADKKAYAADFLDELFNAKGEVLTKEQINVLIEAAVQELQH